MDTISRENNSMLPTIGVAVAAVALLLSAYAALNLSHVKQTLATHEDKLAGLPDIASQASAANAGVQQVKQSLADVAKGANDAFATVSSQIGALQAQVKTLEESHAARATAKGGKGGPVVAGPGEYVVKPGDSLAKIARANGCTLSELQSVNPGVESKKLHIGQKLKLPEKASSAPAAAPAAPAAQ
ncbi:MAG TPA: LysM peptidoglycan-binding domain-containing protein [Opitutaceae bacterium]|jgi:LysM repeat protein|nr:LysM peptidoglycan-binding domain-containing protein [Opitutaceae bacterium]